MKQIKKYFGTWSATRFIRLVLALALVIAFYYNRETLYLLAGIVLGLQAVFNITCPGGSCSTNKNKKNDAVIKINKYEPTK